MEKTGSHSYATRNGDRRNLGRVLLTLAIAFMMIIVPVSVMVTPTSGIVLSTHDASDKLTYEYDTFNMTATVTGYSGDKRSEIKVHITVPATVVNPDDGKTYSVTAIGGDDAAFYHCESLESITLSKGVKTIGYMTFNGCHSLKNVVLPEGFESIGIYAFMDCHSLESITIPDTVTSIGDSAFKNCIKLTSVKLSENITSIADYTFRGCKSLEKITIPKKVSSIGVGAFSNCASLKEIETLSDKFCMKNGAFFDKDCKTLIQYLVNKGAVEYTVPNTVTKICDGAFFGSPLKSITIPNSVVTIEEDVFKSCESLESVTLPNNITGISSEMFSGCSSLKTITIPNKVTTIGRYAFQDCISLNNVTIPDGVLKIDEYAFSNCKSLTTIDIPSTVTTIGSNSFDGCDALEEINVDENNAKYCSIDGVLYNKDVTKLAKCPGGMIYDRGGFTIPSTVTKIDFTALTDITNLECFYVENGNTTFTAEGGVLYKDNGKTLLRYPAGSTDDEFELPAGKTIYQYAFRGCTHLKSVVIPDGYDMIPYAAFKECYSLESVTMPASVKTIVDSAFSDCTSLKTIDLSSVTSIGSFVFSSCKSLESVIIPEGVTKIEWGTFSDCESLVTVKIPKSVTEIYTSTGLDSNDSFNGCKSLKEFIVDKDNQNFKAIDGALFDKSGKTLIRYTPSNHGDYAIPNGVTKIACGAFKDCSFEYISIPSSVTAIETEAFGSLEFYESDKLTLITDYSRIIGKEMISDEGVGSRLFMKGPEVKMTSDVKDWSEVNDRTVVISGESEGDVTVKVNGIDVNDGTTENGKFSVTVTLKEGPNTIDIISTATDGSFTVKTLHVTYTPTGPEPEPKNHNDPGVWILVAVFIIAALLAVFVGVIARRH